MSDTTTTDPKPADDDTKGGKPEYTPPATQADLDKIVAERVARERAKYADYDDLKGKAAKLDEIEAANKTELEKAAERAAAAEAKARDLELKSLRLEVAAAKGVPSDLISGDTKEALEASADALIAFKGGDGKGDDKKSDLYLPNADKTPSKVPADNGEFVRGLFGND